jgi:hypothetical protein
MPRLKTTVLCLFSGDALPFKSRDKSLGTPGHTPDPFLLTTVLKWSKG